MANDLSAASAYGINGRHDPAFVLAATNNGNVSPKDFRGYLVDGARKAERSLRLIHEASPPMDFPAALDFPPSRYLKCWVLQA